MILLDAEMIIEIYITLAIIQIQFDTIQRSIASVTGNTRGGHKQKRRVSWVSVGNAPFLK